MLALTLSQAGWLAAPVVLGGLTHVLAIRADVLPRLAAVPLDGGKSFRGRRVFGDNKTLRGVVVMVLATAIWGGVLGALHGAISLNPDWLVPAMIGVPPLLWGGLLGLGYIIGELPNSFVKRQLDIGPGAPASDGLRRPFWLADQVDSLGGVAVATLPVGGIPGPVLGWLVAITLVLHPTVAWVMVKLGLKERIG